MTGTSINIVSVTKRGASKSSILKQVETINGQLTVSFHESFHFKASLFYQSNGKCIPKIFRLNINRVTRSSENQHEFITTCVGHVVIELHDHANTGTVNYQLQIYDEDSSHGGNGNTGNSKGKLEINLNIISNVEDGLMDDVDNCSSIGSDLSFIQKEQHPSTSNSASPRKSSSRLVGGVLPEAGKSSNWSFNTTTVLQQETEVKATEISIVKMHLERMIVEKENLEAIQKMHLKEISKLQNELKELKGSPSISTMSPRVIAADPTAAVSPTTDVERDQIMKLENENQILRMELQKWKEKYGKREEEDNEVLASAVSSKAYE
jgi:regulator of replication initiation timing